MGPFVAICSPYGAYAAHMGPYGSYGLTWAHMGPWARAPPDPARAPARARPDDWNVFYKKSSVKRKNIMIPWAWAQAQALPDGRNFLTKTVF